MKKSHVIVAICVLLLGGCAHFRALPPLEVRSHPQLAFDKDGNLVTPPVLYFLPGERNVEIVWQLSKDSKYRFQTNPKNSKEQGIVIEGQIADRVLRRGEAPASVPLDPQNEIIDCKVRNEFEFACLNRHNGPGIFKYTIQLFDGPRRLERDPIVVNM